MINKNNKYDNYSAKMLFSTQQPEFLCGISAPPGSPEAASLPILLMCLQLLYMSSISDYI